MALTGQDLLNNFNKLPLAQKAAAVVVAIGLMTGANWYFAVSPMQDDIVNKTKQLRSLEEEWIQKKSIADNLAQFKHEKEILERKLAQALTELPNEANIDELIRSLSEIGNKSGLQIESIVPQNEQKQSFYASIPVAMGVVGNFHELGVFLDSLSKLARIVNVTNIKIDSPAMRNDKLVIKATYVATTFRFLPDPAAAAQAKKEAAK